jgi:hypothetical protein
MKRTLRKHAGALSRSHSVRDGIHVRRSLESDSTP